MKQAVQTVGQPGSSTLVLQRGQELTRKAQTAAGHASLALTNAASQEAHTVGSAPGDRAARAVAAESPHRAFMGTGEGTLTWPQKAQAPAAVQ